MDDVVPGLLKAIQVEFKNRFVASNKIVRIYSKIKSKTATYKEAHEFSEIVGKILAESYKKVLSTDKLPEGRMWYNIATRILEPTFHKNYSLITDVCNEVQKVFNEESGIGLNPVTPSFPTERLEGFINKISNAENFDDVSWMLDEPTITFCKEIVNDCIQENAKFHYDSGLTPKIRRVVGDADPCPWCKALAGTYEYPYVPRDVYRQHNRCRCYVEYIEDGRYKKNIRTNTWVDGETPPEERRKEIEKESRRLKAEKKKEEAQKIIKELMRVNGWDESAATIYYRTNIAPILKRS